MEDGSALHQCVVLNPLVAIAVGWLLGLRDGERAAGALLVVYGGGLKEVVAEVAAQVGGWWLVKSPAFSGLVIEQRVRAVWNEGERCAVMEGDAVGRTEELIEAVEENGPFPIGEVCLRC